MDSTRKPVKAIKLVVDAITNLRVNQGYTQKEIVNFISSNYGELQGKTRLILTALKRGIDYGILRLENGRYDLSLAPSTAATPLDNDNPQVINSFKRRRSQGRCGGKRKSVRRMKRSRRSRSRCGGRRRRRQSHRHRRSSSKSRSRGGGRRRRRQSHRHRRSSSKSRSRSRHSRRRSGKKCGGSRRRRSTRHRSRRHRSRRCGRSHRRHSRRHVRSRRRRAKCRC